MLAYSGCRISEALALDRQSIDHDEACVLIRSLKKRGVMHVRAVPLPGGIVAHIDRVHRLADDGRDERLWRWQRGRAWQLVKAVMMTAQIPPGPLATPKGLRHGFGVNAIAKLVPIHLVQRWLGHANIATTAIYLQVLGSEERAIAERMWRLD